MMTLRNRRLRDYALPMSTTWLVADISEAKGKQELFTRQSPQMLQALREMAIVQSTESSNRIEGVTVAVARLRPLVLGHAAPRDRSEQDVQDYRIALNDIHNRHAGLAISPDTIKHLHALCQAASGDAGHFKKSDNEIVQLLPNAPPLVRFRCVKAAETPAAMDELCLLYRHALDQDHIPPLIATAALVLDFLCIHPFRDGNGRVSRLLTLLALYQHGFEVGRYISLERLIEETKEDYYECLNRSSARWHEGRHDFTPWLNFFLAVVRRGHVEFERRAGQVKAPRGTKAELVLAAIRQQPGEFRLCDLEHACPGVGREWMRKLLSDRKVAGEVTCHGRGPAARWRRSGSKGTNA